MSKLSLLSEFGNNEHNLTSGKICHSMRKITGKWVKILKIVHLIFAFMWIGGAICMVLLLLTTSPQESHEMYMRSRVLQVIDDWLVIPGAQGLFITGIMYGIWTNWGFFKHRWLTVKWILTIFMIFSGTFLMGPWVNGNVYPIEKIADYTAGNREFVYNVLQTLIWGSIQVTLLFTVVIISVLKPWNKRKAGTETIKTTTKIYKK